MPLVVHSPFSGKPVKIRDQDLGRAVRDDAGRIFYAVPRSDGHGCYGAPTRRGSARDEQRYLDMLEKGEVARQVGAVQSAKQIHDATGRRRRHTGRWVLLILFLAAALAAGYYYWFVIQGHPLPRFMQPLGHFHAASDAAVASASDAVVRTAPVTVPPSIAWADEPAIATAINPLPDHNPPRPLVFPPVKWAPHLNDAPSEVATGATKIIELADRAPMPDTLAPSVNRALPEASKDSTAHVELATPAPPSDAWVSNPNGAAAIVEPADAAEPAPALETGTTFLRAFLTTASGLRYRIEEPGTGPTAIAGSFAVIDYVALLEDGTVVDTTKATGPIGFVLWSGQVIRGWDEGVAGMRVGEKRALIIPPELVNPIGSSGESALLPHKALHTMVRLREVRPGITYKIERAGRGPLARPGDMVRLHYTAYVAGSNQPFDSSRHRDRPFQFRIGAGRVISGWELGVSGMAEGEKRTIEIPPYLAYGKRGFGTIIPPDTTLRYDVELLRVH